ncbi:DNA polymerase-3 subunit delta [Rhodoblastus acidophilus]|uniref:DNA polymerase III subunit delta n=1 Tax=Rhodoblastus acidophilus TaxID=1074 RepID=UPI002224AD65|nr:DNA polymerase III subunit delta [Rhodoblastus acidophilus]MCW2284172.1 DNA polymerase-3 subunit delta [Rhodoblastus acidophilus]MCW2333017.1 DNA polymerase-3 subunit delta [Rhodoblastus acidophilus]
MVAIPIGEADDFLAKPFGCTSVILLFGPDRGLVSERSQQASRTFLGGEMAPGQKIQLLGDAIASDPLLLVDEANSIDMFQSSNRCILISVGGKSVLPALEMISRAPPQNCLIVLEAGELRRDAPLRKWAEAHDFAAAIECRPDDARSLMRLIEREFAAAGCAIEPSARDALLGVLGEDRIATRNEIEKLLLFTSGQSTVHCSDVEAICYDPNLTQTDAIVDGAFSSDRQTLLERLHSVSLSGGDPTIILMAMMRHALALQRGVGAVDAGGNPADALQSVLRGTGGFNRKAELMRQMKTCRVQEMLELVRTLQNFTKATRSNPTLSAQRLTRLLISRAGGRRDSSR